MKYAWLVALREYGEHIKTKGFWIGIFLFPVIAFASIKVPMLLDKAKPTRHFTVVDPSGEFTGLIDAAIQAHYDRKNGEALLSWKEKKEADPSTPDFEPLRPLFRRVPLPTEVETIDPKGIAVQLKPWLLGERSIEVDGKEGELFALIVLPESEILLKSHVEYWCTNLADSGLEDVISRGIEDELKRREFLASGVERKEIERINRIDVDFEGKDPKKAAGEEKVDEFEEFRQWAPLGFVYIMFVAIMTVAQMLISSTIEEKSNRIVEVLLSSVTPGELMLGKLLGVAAVGITMLGAWIGSIWGVFKYFAGAGKTEGFIDILTDVRLIGPFVMYFVLGYLLYASILLALGSLCNTLKDAQNFMGPVMMVLMVPLLTMTFVAKDPNGPLAVFLSWIPPFTPFVMMNRAAADPPLFEVAGTLALLLASIALTIWLSGRIFRNGILRTGQPPKLFELIKLVRA